MASVKVLLRKDKSNKQGQNPVIIQIVHNRKKKIINIGHYLSSSEWDSVKELAIEESKIKEQKLYLQKLNINIGKKLGQIKKKIVELEEIGKPFTVDMISEPFTQHYSSISVFKFYDDLVSRLKDMGKIGNALIFSSTIEKFKKFREQKDLAFEEFTLKVIIEFEEFLIKEGCRVNTINTYMKKLRTGYNKAIKEDIVSEEFYPFKNYQIKSEKTVKRAITKENIITIKELDLKGKKGLEKARDIFLFSFYARGMSFVDLAKLKVNDIVGDRILYSRSKTSQKFSIKLTSQISEIISKYNDLSDPDSFLFPIILDPKGDIHKQCYNSIRNTNKNLKKIGNKIGLNIPFTTYVSRHSWATIAKREGVRTSIISEGLGHQSERTTQIYLDSFENDVLDNANDLITNFWSAIN